MQNMVVSAIDQVDVPAREVGVLESLSVKEGDRVSRGQVIGKLDGRRVEVQAELMQADLQIAQKKAESNFPTELAEKDLALAEQMASQQLIASEISRKKAANDVRILAATKAMEIAKNEWQRANDARSRFAESVSTSELDNLRMAYERSQLETQQARFEQLVDGLDVKSDEQESILHQIRIRRAKVTIEQTSADQAILELLAKSKQMEMNLATLTREHHKVVSPLGGVIVQRYQQAGQWVQPGTPIVRIVRMDRLQAEGFLDVTTAIQLRRQQKVTLRCEAAQRDTIVATVTFVSPEVQTVSGKVRVLVEFDNTNESVLPGMRVDMTAPITAPHDASTPDLITPDSTVDNQ